MDRALAGKSAWMAGLRRAEADARVKAPIVARDLRGLIKVNPIATWTDEDVRGYVADHDVIVNPLLLDGLHVDRLHAVHAEADRPLRSPLGTLGRPRQDGVRAARLTAASSAPPSPREDRAAMYEHLSRFCTFIGCTRSGHSLVGALVDAHPNAVVAHEVDVFRTPWRTDAAVELRYPDRVTLFDELVKRAEEQAHEGRVGYRMRPDGTEYPTSYAVANQYQGRVIDLRVIGNKRGQEVCRAITRDRTSLERLRDQVELPIKLIHVVRNPFDNIATMTPLHGERTIVRYFDRAAAVVIAKQDGWDVLDVYIEDMIASPQTELGHICSFLDLAAPPDYLRDCANVVSAEVSETRDRRIWSHADVVAVQRRIAKYPWLARYADTEVATTRRFRWSAMRQDRQFRRIEQARQDRRADQGEAGPSR